MIRSFGITFKVFALGLKLALSFDTNFLVAGVAFATFPVGTFFPFFSLGVRATFGLAGIFLAPTPMVVF